ncbi:MAG: hypothetical protein B6241_01310 [Spirochaetaceae bacterium 4572_59]|nr:MAG: hypothetical protein B6241_01310 [Spirochaetaceae bacterium 4572_59]
MIRNVYINGKIDTLLVMEEEGSTEFVHPLVEALREQAERINTLEQQNDDLMKQEKILLNLLELSAATGEIMARSLKSLENLENTQKKSKGEGPSELEEQDLLD